MNGAATVTPERPKPNWLTAILWLAINVASFGIAGAFFHNFPLAHTFPPNPAGQGAFSLTPAIVGLFFGAIPALLIGWSQRWLVRRYLPLSRGWIVSASAGVALMHFLSDGFENARDLSAPVVVSGLLVGLIQWSLLRPRRLPAWWIPIAGAGWYVGWVAGIAILESTGMRHLPWTGGLDLKQHGLLGMTTGLVSGLSTGLLLAHARRLQPE
jgi:hypothetical protein